MSMLTKEKEKVLTIDQIYGEFLSAEMVSNQNETSIVTVSSNSNDVPAVGITFLDEKIGALICDDIGNRDYDAIFVKVVEEYSKSYGKYDPEDKVFHEMVRERLKTLPIEISGYKLIDFASGTVENGLYKATGFQGGIYYNETTGDYVVVCRGTEFDGGEEQFKDFVKTDICGFGQDHIPDDFHGTEDLLDRAIELAGGDHTKIHIVGHSLGGGVAQMLGAMDAYKDIDVTTYNAVGIEHLLGDLEGADIEIQDNAKEAANIINYVTCNDVVSTIFNLIGNETIVVEPIKKNDSLKNYIQWQIENGGKTSYMEV